MPAAGDDLRKYLIVPSPASSPLIQQSSSQCASSFSNPASRPDTPRFHKSANRKAEDIRMEVDYPTQPPALASPHTGAEATITAPIEGVMSLDDFLANHQADHDAALAAREAARAPPAKKNKKNDTTTPPQPVAVGARSSKYTILLHEKHQVLAIPKPVFTYSGDSVNGWTVEVSFPGLPDAEELGLQGIKEDGRFNSKQEAKEAASKTAVAILEELEQAGRISKPGKTKKPKGEPTHYQPKEKEEPGENYVGQLIEFQRSISSPQPTYTDYQLGTRWACLLEIEGYDGNFGSLDALFGSKKAARQHAAGCAVKHFKDQGVWPEEFTDAGGIKKRKPATSSPVPNPSSPDGRNLNVASSLGGASATQQVANLAVQLSLGTPEYRFTPSNPGVSDIHTVSCYFRDGGAHGGPIGEVRNVYGKKKAKEECARLTLQYLSDLKKQREDVAARLIAGIAGAAGAGSVGLGMAMDVEGFAGKQASKVAVGSDDELDIYEDAMEF